MANQIRGIILEGQSCSGKSSIFNAIKKYHIMQNDNERNVIFLSEQYSQNLNLVNGKFEKLSEEENLKVLIDRITMLEQLNNYANSMGLHSRRSRGLFYVFERFHFNYAFCFSQNIAFKYKEVEDRLKNLNAYTILCTISDNKIEQRLKHRATLTNEVITEDIVNEYKKNQDLFIKIANNSNVSTTILNTDNMDWDHIAKEIYRLNY
ncbi:hypothetical protein JYG23_00265 [Sedimentibacter sp. zth1]|uniref:hypothetical protein n=1 Tax=Sedimentibacter sp. zth1 TaxID=2816908 RepID=UPI001A922C01|nr:hypothetical protein [Sedimentibacter sp. zth1]QSX05938.1 hypothetical protein JYG23_00265 [Sedimentibacter sp. zth1]